MRTDAEIRQAVLHEIARDPRLKDADVGVTVSGGLVTLVGTVSSYARLIAAEEATHRVEGVLDVVNDVQVQIPSGMLRADADVAQAVRRALEWDVLVHDREIQATVSDGWVTLSGSVDFGYERESAERAIRNLAGVRGITNNISVKGPKVHPDDVRREIERALERRARYTADRLVIDVRDGVVTLSGTVHSWAEKDALLVATRIMPGVESVKDRLVIVPEV